MTKKEIQDIYDRLKAVAAKKRVVIINSRSASNDVPFVTHAHPDGEHKGPLTMQVLKLRQRGFLGPDGFITGLTYNLVSDDEIQPDIPRGNVK